MAMTGIELIAPFMASIVVPLVFMAVGTAMLLLLSVVLLALWS
jgi:hypothetical protein